MTKQGFATAKRRYNRVFWPLMGAYLIVVLGGSLLIVQYDDAPGWLPVMVAVLAALTLFGVLVAALRYFEETDEYTRLRQLTAFARGAVITVSAIFLVGFLQMFDVVGAVDVFWFGPLFLFSWGLAYCGARFIGGTV